jgi:hypothetical protein
MLIFIELLLFDNYLKLVHTGRPEIATSISLSAKHTSQEMCNYMILWSYRPYSCMCARVFRKKNECCLKQKQE